MGMDKGVSRVLPERYDPARVETSWQREWEARAAYEVREGDSRPKYYLLEMFPYPSGRIHMGHVRNYSIGDVVARFKRMRGFNVLHPMGWDAFGLPAENAAIEHNAHPAKWTAENIAYMRNQLKRMGFSYDWRREFATCDPRYYRWEQGFFLDMLERGLAYKSKATVNWCEHCQTVLANEQVKDGCCWRCECPVTDREFDQWFFRITAYAEELLAGCDRLTGWPEKVLTMQRNWIGKSVGAQIDFPLVGREGKLTVFTTRQDTVFGATFMSLAVEHPLVGELSRGTEAESAVRDFVQRVKRQSREERATGKEGVFVGAFCRNPFTGWEMPIYAANFVLREYGSGAVMGVPCHDQRDFEFAEVFGLPKVVVVQPPGEELRADEMQCAYEGPGRLVGSAQFSGLDSEEGKERIVAELEARGLGRRGINYRLRDWGISRQRYWGAPIPVVYCGRCGTVPVRREDLPVVLPIEKVEFSALGGSPLARVSSFVNTACPECGGPGRREADTMDTFVESSWYFLRYTCAQASDRPLVPEAVKYWMPVDLYIGGIEHAVLHLLYARFYTKVLRDLGYCDQDEPFTNLLTQGMVIKDGAKMSKSKGNVVDPDYLIEKYGADTARLFSLFAAPPEKDLEWSDEGVEGCYRFLNRLWRSVANVQSWVAGARSQPRPSELSNQARDLRRLIHQTIRRVTEDIEVRLHFNTAVAAVMELLNGLNPFATVHAPSDPGLASAVAEGLDAAVLMLSPMVPHVTAELWRALGHEEALDWQAWPKLDESALAADEVELAVQVNGRVRAKLKVSPSASEREIIDMALRADKVRAHLAGRKVKKTIVVPGRLVSISA